jgi:hypothetical protein
MHLNLFCDRRTIVIGCVQYVIVNREETIRLTFLSGEPTLSNRILKKRCEDATHDKTEHLAGIEQESFKESKGRITML